MKKRESMDDDDDDDVHDNDDECLQDLIHRIFIKSKFCKNVSTQYFVILVLHYVARRSIQV